MYCYMCSCCLNKRGYARVTPYSIQEQFKFYNDKDLFDSIYKINAKDYICLFCFNMYTYYVNRFCSNTGKNKRDCVCLVCKKVRDHIKEKILLYFVVLDKIEINIKRKIIEEHLKINKKLINLIFN